MMASIDLNEQYKKRLLQESDDFLTYLTPATRLLCLRQEMNRVDLTLSSQKDEFNKKMQALKRRRFDLERKELEMKESLKKFDKFLQEIDLKKKRALKKAENGKEIIQIKDKEIAKLQSEIKSLLKSKDRVVKQVNEHVIYQRFLTKVQQTSEDFNEIRDIIGRYDTLVSTREDLLERHNKSQELLKQKKSSLLQYTEDKNNEILRCNLHLAELQTRLDHSRILAMQRDAAWTKLCSTATKKTLLLGNIIITTHNLYQLIERNRKYGRTDDEEMTELFGPQQQDTVGQLAKIKEYMRDLDEIMYDGKASSKT